MKKLNAWWSPNSTFLKIREIDSLTPKVIKVLTQFKDHFVIITTAKEVPINKGDFLWNFERIELKNLSRSNSFELIQRLSYDLEIEDYEMFRAHIFDQTDGNPRAILEMVDRYRKEPFILRETIRSITHSGAFVNMNEFLCNCLSPPIAAPSHDK